MSAFRPDVEQWDAWRPEQVVELFDFAAALPRLHRAWSEWLREALGRVHPGHEWLAEIESVAA